VSMVGDVDPAWSELYAGLEEQGGALASSTLGLIVWATEFLGEYLPEEDEISQVLSQALESRKQLLERDIENASAQFLQSLDTLRIDALSSIRSSYIGTEMEDAYLGAMSEFGTGSDRRRKAIINGAVGRNHLFKDILKRFRRAFEEQADTHQQIVRTVVESHLESIRHTLDMIRNENVVLESERDPEFRASVEAGIAEAGEEIRRISSALSS
jgi:hypothetical protein